MRTYLPSISILSIFAVFYCCASTQKNEQVASIKQLAASKQAYAGGAAGTPPGTVYLIRCKILIAAEISNIKATIDTAPVPVKLAFKNSEYDKISLLKGDTFFFRITRRVGAGRPLKENEPIPERVASSPRETNKSETVNIRYTINKRNNEQLQVKKFSEIAPHIYQ